MPYLQKNRTAKPYRTRTAIVIGLFFACALLFSLFGGFLSRIASPLWKGENMFAHALSTVFSYIHSKNALIAENEMLKRELISNSLFIESCRATDARIDTIQGLLGRSGGETLVAASVLVRPPETPYDILVVDAGSNQGILVGDTVALPEGTKIGEVMEVFSKTSKIRLYTLAGEKTDAVLERGGEPIELLGRGGGSFEFITPRETLIEVGDRIVSATLDGAPVGIVRDVESTPTDSFKKALVEAAFNLSHVRFVSIIK